MSDQRQQLDAVDAMLAELGIDATTAGGGGGGGQTQAAASPQQPRMSAGPGAMSRGPGGMSNGPGAGGMMSNGPGGMSRGPGGMSNGPGGMSRGPGGMMSSGPGAAGLRGPNSPLPPVAAIKPATHTPDGRAITFTGPPCAACGEMIIGPVTNALEKQWHPEHFICTHCRRPFKGGNFVEFDGKAYCDDDYTELFGPKCAVCMKAVGEKVINACGKVYHPEHFFCTGCGTELRGKTYKEDEGEPFCVNCKAARTIAIAPPVGICGKCKKPIIGEYITLNGVKMHPEHYRCEECGCEFKGGNCHEYEQKLYCYPDYLKLLKSICALCQKPIIGRSITALGKVWHPEHFCCTTCKVPFASSTFYENKGLPYCDVHYLQHFGKACFRCQKPIASNTISALGKFYHKECFTCSGCDKLMGKDVYDFESKPLCNKCYDKLPKEVKKRIKAKKEGDDKAQKAREKEAKKAAAGS